MTSPRSANDKTWWANMKRNHLVSILLVSAWKPINLRSLSLKPIN